MADPVATPAAGDVSPLVNDLRTVRLTLDAVRARSTRAPGLAANSRCRSSARRTTAVVPRARITRARCSKRIGKPPTGTRSRNSVRGSHEAATAPASSASPESSTTAVTAPPEIESDLTPLSVRISTPW